MISRLWRPTAVIGFLFLAGASVISGCFGDPGPSGKVGVRSSSGAILIDARPCHGDALVERVDIRLKNEDGPIVWTITSSDANPQRTFQIGQVPAGFVQVTPLAEPLKERTPYVVFVSLKGEALALGSFFDLETLQEERWTVGSSKRQLTDEQFQQLDPCPQ